MRNKFPEKNRLSIQTGKNQLKTIKIKSTLPWIEKVLDKSKKDLWKKIKKLRYRKKNNNKKWK